MNLKIASKPGALMLLPLLAIACAPVRMQGPVERDQANSTQDPEAVATPQATSAAESNGPTPGGGLRFEVEPRFAVLEVNGTPHGTVSALNEGSGVLKLKPGLYQVSLKAPGYLTWRAEVSVDQAEQPLQVTLVAKQ